MVAVSALIRYTNMAAVTSRENALFPRFHLLRCYTTLNTELGKGKFIWLLSVLVDRRPPFSFTDVKAITIPTICSVNSSGLL